MSRTEGGGFQWEMDRYLLIFPHFRVRLDAFFLFATAA
jgi:hypothetical protein